MEESGTGTKNPKKVMPSNREVILLLIRKETATRDSLLIFVKRSNECRIMFGVPKKSRAIECSLDDGNIVDHSRVHNIILTLSLTALN